MILSRYFGKSEYGTYKQIIYVYTTLTIIFTAGLPSVFAYFLPHYSLNQGKEIVWRITKILFLFGLLFSFFLFVFSGHIASILKNTKLTFGLKIFSLVPVLMLPTLGIEGIFATYRRTVFITIYNFLTRLIMVICITAPVVFLKNTYIYSIYGWILASFITLIIALIFKELPFKGIDAENSSIRFREIFRYSFPIALSSIWGIAIISSNQFFISRYFGPAKFAEFANGFIQLPVIGMVTGAASTVLMPIFSKMVHNNEDKNKLFELWKSAIVKSALIIYPILIFCIFEAKEIITILYTKSYDESAIYFQISLAINIFSFVFFNSFLLAMGKSNLYAKVHLYAAVVLWLLQFLTVILFHSPIILVIVFGLVQLGINAFLLHYIANYFKVTIFFIIPVKKIIMIILHSIIIATLLLLITTYLEKSINNIVLLIGQLIFFSLILLCSGRFIKINYLMPFYPFLIKYFPFLIKNDF